jgi:hypothetical protein
MAEVTLCTTNWTLEFSGAENTGSGSCSTGYTFAVDGRKDCVATVEFLWDASAALPATPGASDLIKLYTDGTHFWSFDAICERVSGTINVETGEAIKLSYTFPLNYSSNAPTWTGTTGDGPLAGVNAKVVLGTA